MDILVLTLDRSQARQAAFAANMQALGIAFSFFCGFDGARGEHAAVSRYDEAAALRARGTPLVPAEAACFAGHYSLWQRCADAGAPMVVMEDDVIAGPDFGEALALAASRIAEHLYIRLAGTRPRPFRVIEDIGRWQLVRFLRGPYGTTGYAISPGGAAALLAGADRWLEPVDRYVDAFWRHGVESKAILPFALRHSGGVEPATIGIRGVPATRGARLRRQRARIIAEARRTLYNLTHR